MKMGRFTFDDIPYLSALLPERYGPRKGIDGRAPGGQGVRVPGGWTLSGQRVASQRVVHLPHFPLELLLVLRDDAPLADAWRQSRG